MAPLFYAKVLTGSLREKIKRKMCPHHRTQKSSMLHISYMRVY
jgi:hypothetical protein